MCTLQENATYKHDCAQMTLLFNSYVFKYRMLVSFGKKDIFCSGEAYPVLLCCGVV